MSDQLAVEMGGEINMRIMLVIHLTIAIVYGAIVIIAQKKLGFAKFIFALCMPFAGIVVLILSDLFALLKRNKRFDYSELSMNDEQDNMVEIRQSDDGWIAPIQDVLTISEDNIKRKVMLNILKRDTFKYVSQLKIALSDEDTETAHYAAAGLVQIKARYDNLIEQYLRNIERNSDDPILVYELMGILFEYINMDILDQISSVKYCNKLIDCMINLKVDKEHIPFNPLYQYCVISLRIAHPDTLDELHNLVEYHPGNEQSYVLLMNYYYQQQDLGGVQKTMDQLTKSKVVLSRPVLQLIRFYTKHGSEA